MAARRGAATDMRPARLGTHAAVIGQNASRARAWVAMVRERSPYGERDPDYQFLRALVDLRIERQPALAVRRLIRMQALNDRSHPVQRDLLLWDALGQHGWRLLLDDRVDLALHRFKAAAYVARRLGHADKVLTARANYALGLQHDNRMDESQEAFEALHREDPTHPAWNLHLAMCLGSQHKFAEAIPFYRTAIARHVLGSGLRLEADLRRARLRLGNCLRLVAQATPDPSAQQQLFDEAETWLRTYIDLEPDEPLGPMWLGTLFFDDLERPYDALPLFERAFELDELCVQPLRRMIQIRSNYPPPDGVTVQAWRGPVAALKRNLAEGAERRRLALEARAKQRGNNGCQ